MISTEWVKNIDDQKDRDDFESILRNSTFLLDRLRAILAEWENDVYSADRSKKQYETANWEELQAHRNGNLETILKLKDLLSF